MPPRREAREQSCSSQRYQPDRSDGVADGPRTTFGRRLVCHVRKPLRLGGLSRVAHVTAQSSAATRRPACTSAFSARDEGPVRAPLRPFGGMLKVTEPTEISNLFENNPRPPGVNHSAPLRVPRGAFLFVSTPVREGSGRKCSREPSGNREHLRVEPESLAVMLPVAEWVLRAPCNPKMRCCGSVAFLTETRRRTAGFHGALKPRRRLRHHAS